MNNINDTVKSINTSSHRFVNTSLVQQPSYSPVSMVMMTMVMVMMIMVMVMMIMVTVMMIICHDNVVGDY